MGFATPNAVTIGVNGTNTTFDFERGAWNKDDCRHDGWVGYLKNQGQCAAFFSSERAT